MGVHFLLVHAVVDPQRQFKCEPASRFESGRGEEILLAVYLVFCFAIVLPKKKIVEIGRRRET